jgi:hypothetical protein
MLEASKNVAGGRSVAKTTGQHGAQGRRSLKNRRVFSRSLLACLQHASRFAGFFPVVTTRAVTTDCYLRSFQDQKLKIESLEHRLFNFDEFDSCLMSMEQLSLMCVNLPDLPA